MNCQYWPKEHSWCNFWIDIFYCFVQKFNYFSSTYTFISQKCWISLVIKNIKKIFNKNIYSVRPLIFWKNEIMKFTCKIFPKKKSWLLNNSKKIVNYQKRIWEVKYFTEKELNFFLLNCFFKLYYFSSYLTIMTIFSILIFVRPLTIFVRPYWY